MARKISPLLLVLALVLPRVLIAQLQETANIIGQLHVAKGDFPSHQVLIELRYRGSAIVSAYADSEGKFGFSNLVGGEYHIIINDEAYYPVDERVILNPDVSPYAMAQITLRPRENAKKADPIGARASGSNPYLVDLADYNKHFAKEVLKEYKRGLEAEHKGKREEAIAHYVGVLYVAPDYYPAHNNLGALYLSKTDFRSAEEQFRQALRLDQSDVQAYFNLANVLMLTGRYGESERALGSGLQRRPDSAFGHFLQGCLWSRTGKYAEAEKSLRDALRLDSTMWQVHLQLVNVYLQQGRREHAIGELQTFLKNFPAAPAASNAAEVLHNLQTQTLTVSH